MQERLRAAGFVMAPQNTDDGPPGIHNMTSLPTRELPARAELVRKPMVEAAPLEDRPKERREDHKRHDQIARHGRTRRHTPEKRHRSREPEIPFLAITPFYNPF